MENSIVAEKSHVSEDANETQNLKTFVHSQEIELADVANLRRLGGMPIGIPSDSAGFLENFRYAVVLGAFR